MPKIREDIGICMQQDCLFPELTAREHIQFFVAIKGTYGKVQRIEVEKQVDQALFDVGMSEKRHALSKNLSGGMKRKLSVAIAFCGGSKVVLLDEPTAGQDPFSRRFTWNVIRSYKKDRIIILTTHFMDEADILGDRIAIMADGRLRCVGSSLFLKKNYGVGYQLTIARRKENVRSLIDEPENCSSKIVADVGFFVDELTTASSQRRKLKRVVTDTVRDAVLLSDVGSELSFQLPLSASTAFVPLFVELDKQIETKAIDCYGVSMTTLNEVFLIVTKGNVQKDIENDLGSCLQVGPNLDRDDVHLRRGTMNSVDTTLDSDLSEDDFDESLESRREEIELEESGLFSRQIVALLKKRSSVFRRDKKAWMCTTIVPSLFVLVGFLVFAFATSHRNMVPLILSLNDYNLNQLASPLPFNSADSPFLCQLGICSHKEPFNRIDETNETYLFCGYEARLGASETGFHPSNSSCSVFPSTDVVAHISSEKVLPDDIGAGNVKEVSDFSVFNK